MRNPENVLISLTKHSNQKDYKYERLYRLLYNEELYLTAYQNIYSNDGSMTKGTDNQTVDGMSIERIRKIIVSLKDESYQPKPARRTYIPKKNGKMRPLGIPSFEDKLLQEVIRMILEAIYEGHFENTSHGFRPNRSCHTAHSWLYDKSGNLREPREISKYDLDTSLYGEVIPDKNFYSMLGFIETEDDNTAEAFEHVDKLDTRNKKLLLRQLARELGMKVSDGAEDDTNNDEEEKDDIFSADTYVSEAFPVSRVRNIESLIEHVRQQFFCADPVTYHKVLRQIRTSKSKKADRAYVTGMYLNDSHVKICQMCKKPSTQVYVTEVANYGIELPQMNLCLCPNCSGHYKSLRDNNKEAFKEAMKVAILSLNIEENSDEYEIQLDSDTSLYFTETHVAEIQTILGLISEYGVPDGNQEERLEKALMETEMLQEEIGSEQAAATLESGKMLSEPEIEEKLEYGNQEEKNEPTINESDLTSATETEFDFLTNTEPIQDGNLVSYKKMQTLEIVDAVMDSTKYPLHKAFLGKKVGDLVVLNGRRYLIISIL